VRLAVYSDDIYHLVDGGVHGERAHTLFLAALGDHVERLTLIGRLSPESARARYRLPSEVGFVPLPFYPSLGRPLQASARMGGALRRFRRALDDVDAVWLLGPHPLSLAFAAAARLSGRPTALGVRQDWVRYVRSRYPRRPLMWLAGAALEGAWLALAKVTPTAVVGPALARRYRGARRLLPLVLSLVGKSDVVSPGAAAGRSYEGELVLLSVGRIDREKNPLILAEILALLRRADPRWRLVVCGEGPMEEALRRRLADRGLSGNAELRGYVPYDRGLRELYRNSHALIHTAWTEGLPQVLLEAFAAGLPTVATEVGGVRAVGEAVRLVPPGSVGPAVSALQQIADDEGLRAALIAAGHRYAQAHTIEEESRRLVRFLSGSG
jgi:glycosyltransferase involved in cell wall biosynthesis